VDRLLHIILSNFARDLGLADYIANLSTALFIERNREDIESINSFTINNCAHCDLREDRFRACRFLNPSKTINITKEEVIMMNFNLITQGKITKCPQFQGGKNEK